MSSRCFKLLRLTAHIRNVSRSTDSISFLIMSETSRESQSLSSSGNWSTASCFRLSINWVTSERQKTPSRSKSKILKQTKRKTVSQLHQNIQNELNNKHTFYPLNQRSPTGGRNSTNDFLKIQVPVAIFIKCREQSTGNGKLGIVIFNNWTDGGRSKREK